MYCKQHEHMNYSLTKKSIPISYNRLNVHTMHTVKTNFIFSQVPWVIASEIFPTSVRG